MLSEYLLALLNSRNWLKTWATGTWSAFSAAFTVPVIQVQEPAQSRGLLGRGHDRPTKGAKQMETIKLGHETQA